MKITDYFILFIFYSMIGWLLEVTNSYIKNKKFINRGFLIGPYCPIYGFGVLSITILLNKYLDEPITLFVMSMVICSVLEYITSYIMEKLFKTRWWDYSTKKFNINGRICLETTVPFGVVGAIVSYFVNPTLMSLISKIPQNVLSVLAIIIFSILMIDLAVSSSITTNLKKISLDAKEDSTEKIKKEISKRIRDNNARFYYRIIKAFPSLKPINKK